MTASTIRQQTIDLGQELVAAWEPLYQALPEDVAINIEDPRFDEMREVVLRIFRRAGPCATYMLATALHRATAATGLSDLRHFVGFTLIADAERGTGGADHSVTAQRLSEAREMIAFVRDWFRAPAAQVSPHWGHKFPNLMATWMERSADWLDRHEQLGGNGDVPSPSAGVPPCIE